MDIDLQVKKHLLVIFLLLFIEWMKERNKNSWEQITRKNKKTALKEKLRKLEQNTTSFPEIKQLQKSNLDLESTVAKKRRKYDELTDKYEILEEHIITKNIRIV